MVTLRHASRLPRQKAERVQTRCRDFEAGMCDFRELTDAAALGEHGFGAGASPLTPSGTPPVHTLPEELSPSGLPL